MKNRIELAKHFATLGLIKGAEVGVFEGRFSEILLKTIPNLQLLCVDDWVNARIPAYEKAVKRLSVYPNATVLRQMSMEAVKNVPDESLDFVYIDANHSYNWVKDDIREWSKKVRKGGIVSGDDYYIMPSGNAGVVRAVDQYVKEHTIELFVTDWDKENEYQDDQQPNWWFVK